MRHLLAGCKTCLAAVPPPFATLLGSAPIDADPTPEEEAARAAAVHRAFEAVREHARHLSGERERAKKAVAALEAGGLDAVEKVARRVKGLALFEALLARSWALRHEDPRLMVQYAWLATGAAEKLDVRKYGEKRLADFHCRAWAELGNALRVAEQLDQAELAFGRAIEWHGRGTNDMFLGIRLLELQAALAADQRRFKLACKSLSLVYRFYRAQGDRQRAGSALISKGLYTGYAGDPEAALEILRKGYSLIDLDSDPNLAFAAVHNQLWFLVECGHYREAKKLLFLNRRYCEAAGGQVHRLRLLWLEARIDAGLGEVERAARRFYQVRSGYQAMGRSYHASIASLDLAAMLLVQGKADEAQDLVVEAARVFSALGIAREALGAVLLLRQSFEVRAATATFVEEVAAFLRRIEHDPKARFDPR